MSTGDRFFFPRRRGLARALVALAAFLPACGGGGGGGDDDDGGGGGPPPAFADSFETGLALAANFQNAAVVARRIAAPVSEPEMGADLNGDGDTLDDVLHLVDTDTNTNVNHGLAVIGPVLASDRHFAFLVSEGAQGLDLNGDGDVNDAVWHVLDPGLPSGAGNPLNTGIATGGTGLPGVGVRGGFLLLQSEAAQGADLNQDGDAIDTIGALFDGAAFGVTGLTGAIAPATPLPARNARVAFTLGEAFGSVDLNQDGDMTDLVLGFADFTLSPPTLGRPGAPGARAIANHPYALTDDGLAYFIDEASDGMTDLNTDGDAADAILAVFEITGGTGEATPIAPGLLPVVALAGEPAFGIAAGRHHVLVGVSESDNGQNDFNGDGDTADAVIGWIDTRVGRTGTLNVDTSLPLGTFPNTIDGARGIFGVSEADRGPFDVRDLNDDGDETDVVAFVVDTTTNTFTNLGLAVARVTLNRDDALLGVSEAAQGGIDRNGDGQPNDLVESYVNLADPALTEHRLGFSAIALRHFRFSPTEVRVAGLFAEGSSANFGDLNGDGDLLDRGVELIVLNPVADPAGPVAPTPFFAGTASLGNDRPLSVGTDVFAFPCAEISVAQDLNGDGDAFDTVLHFVRIK